MAFVTKCHRLVANTAETQQKHVTPTGVVGLCSLRGLWERVLPASSALVAQAPLGCGHVPHPPPPPPHPTSTSIPLCMSVFRVPLFVTHPSHWVMTSS